MMMLKIPGLLAGSLIVAIALPTAPANAEESPDVRLKSVIEEVLDSMRSRQEEFRDDDEALFAYVEEMLEPILDNDRIVRIILGKKQYNEATPQQREDFSQSILQQLIQLYSKTILKYAHGEVRYLPYEPRPDKPYQVVNTEFLVPAREPVALTYLMREVEGNWRLFEVRAQGIYLFKSVRKSLRPEIEEKGLDAESQRLRASAQRENVSARFSHWLDT